MNRPILRLPAKREPRQLTAVHTAQNLTEHRESFHNACNPNGFVEEPLAEDPDTLGALFRKMMGQPYTTKDEVRALIASGMAMTDKQMRMADFYTIVARLFGYTDWSAAREVEDSHGRIANKNYNSKSINLELFGVVYDSFLNGPRRRGVDVAVNKTRVPLGKTQAFYQIVRACELSATRGRISNLMNQMADELPRNIKCQDAKTRYFFRTDENNPNTVLVVAREFIPTELSLEILGYAVICLAIDPETRLIVGVSDNIRHFTNEEFTSTGLSF